MIGDPTAGLGILAAMFAGAISFLSPCVLPLVPGYLSAVTGLTPNDLDDAPVRRVLVPSLLFVASAFAVVKRHYAVLMGFGINGQPAAILFDREGVARAQWFGPFDEDEVLTKARALA